MNLRAACVGLAGAALLALAGCGPGMPPTHPVSGKVVFTDGAPVTSGVVEFESLDQPFNARGAIGPDGSFRLQTRERDGAIVGRHRAIVIQPLAGGIGTFAAQDEASQQTPHRHADHDHEAHIAAEPAGVARHYADYRTSKLEFEVRPDGANEFTIQVERATPVGGRR